MFLQISRIHGQARAPTGTTSLARCGAHLLFVIAWFLMCNVQTSVYVVGSRQASLQASHFIALVVTPGIMLRKPDPDIVKLLHEPSDARLVSTVDDVLSKLEADGLAYRLSIPPKLVGVHPCNRDGYGISTAEVHSLGSDIVSMGWSWQSCAHAVCVEDDRSSTMEQYTYNLVSTCDGLGQAVHGQVKYGSLSCGHTNRFLCALLDEVPSEHEILTVDGRMSMSKVTANDSKLKEAMSQGLRWLVLTAEAAEVYPSLCDKVQRARNATGQAQRAESAVQMLLRIQNLAREHSKASGGQVDWAHITNVITKRLPQDSELYRCERIV